MAHAPLLRTNTAPVFQASMDGVARLTNTMSMSSAPRASQLSGSTAVGSTTSLNTLTPASTATPPPGNGGPVMATGNIINQKADASRSLYQICVSLKQRLAQVPGWEGYLTELEHMAADLDDGGPVESLWKLLRTGYPLLAIYNALQPEKPLQVEQKVGDHSEAKRAKIAILKFVQACLNELKLPPAECFIINDLTGNDTTGFVKVTVVINYVLDLLEQRGLLRQVQPYPEDDSMQPGSQMSYRDYIVRELVDTERKYVQDLENLHDLKETLEQRGVIPGDVVHNIFLNINTILDIQRKFLIRVETTNSMAQARQEWGSTFVAYEDSFNMCYQPFIANQRKAAQLASQVFDKIQAAEHPVACDFNTLDGFLLKPMQRLVKYPLLLKDLMKKSEDDATKADLSAGISAAERVLQRANDAVDRDLLDEALDDLINRVDDWKNHRVDQFGKLLLHGVYTVITGKSEQEKDYEIYLFECILLCCKEIVPNKSRDKKDKTRSTGPKLRNKNAKLQLKGRIFMTNVTDVVAISRTGSYTVQIWWKGDPGVENFMIKFQNEEMMKKWASGLDQQRKENAPPTQASPDQPPPNFAWIETQGGALKNPYAEQDADEDDDSNGPTPTPGFSQYGAAAPVSLPGTMQRNASSTSLRQRSATNESAQSLAGIARAPPPRFPLPQPPAPLSLQTSQMGQPTPTGPRGGDSYFSPVAESPASSRTSTTSGIFNNSMGYPFPKTTTPQPGWGGEDSNRYTAPAMPRAPSRDGPSPANAYGMVAANGRNPRGPSMPVMPRDQRDSTLQAQRSRSYSTPDINGQSNGRNGQSTVPAVPGIPAHLTHSRHDSNIPRSNTGSPANEIPVRTNTSSPGAQRTRQGGTMAQFPTQPIFPRQGTPGNGVNLPPPGPSPMGMAPLAPLDPSRTVSPTLGNAAPMPPATPNPDMPLPTQLKVKVNCESGTYVTLVVQFNITYQSLVDRIDAKLARFSNSSIGKGNLRLRYRDEDGDFVTIESDDDIQIAISEWREGLRGLYNQGVGEIELFCVGEIN
ncbi:Pleckstrin homology domain-containing protein [Apodospora peruviana]|uniref:Pleckstrin homology domain-containing protein n=1 Tax=Apodospora peruviana TaxID=516989 RepID=A0AAE0HUJ3_9PEZI|nr:Pleckstrin homology domain-containing protein [Apodospora peruviana]